MPLSKGDVLNHLIQTVDQLKQSGVDTSKQEQAIAKIKSDPRHQDLSQPLNGADQILGQSSPQNSPQMNPGQLQNSPTVGYNQKMNSTPETPSPSVETATPQTASTPGYDENDVQSLIKRAMGAGKALNPNAVEGIGGIISMIGGGKPYVSPSREIATKAAEKNLSMTPIDYALKASLIGKNDAQKNNFNTQSGVFPDDNASGGQLPEIYENAAQLIAQGKMSMDEVSKRYPGLQMKIVKRATELNKNFQGQTYGVTNKFMQAGAKGFATQDAKVNQAIHGQQIINEYPEETLATKPLPQMAFESLVNDASNLLSNGTGSAQGDRELLRQQTLYGQFQGTLSYLTGDPHAANTPQVIHTLYDIFKRQGGTSQELKQGYLDSAGLGGMKIGNNFNDYVKNGDQQSNQQNNGLIHPQTASYYKSKGAVGFSRSKNAYVDAQGNIVQ